MINVSWQDAVEYAAWLSKQTGKPYQLPTEAQWEYAARGGTTGDYYWGDGNAEDFAWSSANSGGKTQPVREKKPNKFGLHDMSGNVWEWTADCWHSEYDNAPGDGAVWLGADNGDCGRRVVRGGSWFNIPQYLRSAGRNRVNSDAADLYLGFRVARAL